MNENHVAKQNSEEPSAVIPHARFGESTGGVIPGATRQPSPSSVRDFLVDRLDALLSDCDQVMDRADYGRTLHDLDDFLFVEGKKFINEVLKEKLQERIETTESTPETKQCSECKKKRTPTTGSPEP